MIRVRLVNYFDVWGNEVDGWQVNDLCAEWERHVPDLEDATLLQLLVAEGFLRHDVGLDQVEFIFIGPEMVEIEQTADGLPLGRLEILETVGL